MSVPCQLTSSSSPPTSWIYRGDNYSDAGGYDNGTAQGKGRTEYIWLPTEDGGAIPVGMYRGGRLYAIHSDHLGTPRLVTDAANQPVWQWPYSAFGDNQPTGVLRSKREEGGSARIARTEPGVELNLRFPGQYADAETGTFYNYFRDYDAAQGRYRSADPVGVDGGFNRFSYADGNPIVYGDPTGEIAFVPIAIGIGVGYAFDYLLEQYKKEHCTCKDTAAGAAGNAAAGGAVGGSGPFAAKPRGGVAGGGPAGTTTSSFSQMNHAAASRGWYSTAARNQITKFLRKVPYAGAAFAAFEIYEAFSCN